MAKVCLANFYIFFEFIRKERDIVVGEFVAFGLANDLCEPIG
jgi:hypothetical protein